MNADFTCNIQDIINTLREDSKNSETADIANASIDVALACAKLIGLYKDYYSKGCKKIRWNGESHTLDEWSRIQGIPKMTLRRRILDSHWDIGDALTTPPKNHAQSRNFIRCVAVLQYNYKRELVREFRSIKEAARQLGINSQTVASAIEGMDPLEQVGRFGFYLQTPKEPTMEEIEELMAE